MEFSRDPLRGYREALPHMTSPSNPNLVREGNWQLSIGYEATKSLMALERPPTQYSCQ